MGADVLIPAQILDQQAMVVAQVGQVARATELLTQGAVEVVELMGQRMWAVTEALA